MNQKEDQENQAKTEEQKRQVELAAQRERNRMRFGASGKSTSTSQPGTETSPPQAPPPGQPTVVPMQPGIQPGQQGGAVVQPTPPTTIQPVPEVPGSPVQPPKPPLLYKSLPAAEWYDRRFDRQYHKGGAVYNPYKIGAMEALKALLKKDLYEIIEEMMDDYFEKYGDVLEGRPDVVRQFEARWRKDYELDVADL